MHPLSQRRLVRGGADVAVNVAVLEELSYAILELDLWVDGAPGDCPDDPDLLQSTYLLVANSVLRQCSRLPPSLARLHFPYPVTEAANVTSAVRHGDVAVAVLGVVRHELIEHFVPRPLFADVGSSGTELHLDGPIETQRIEYAHPILGQVRARRGLAGQLIATDLTLTFHPKAEAALLPSAVGVGDETVAVLGAVSQKLPEVIAPGGLVFRADDGRVPLRIAATALGAAAGALSLPWGVSIFVLLRL
mmetsp:Transcript_16767/g.48279  ORF Transcript_16767/g.48279 Transcript_16767/m.48279 type:complete len:248 (-) Transcript_16767:150-893(-)